MFCHKNNSLIPIVGTLILLSTFAFSLITVTFVDQLMETPYDQSDVQVPGGDSPPISRNAFATDPRSDLKEPSETVRIQYRYTEVYKDSRYALFEIHNNDSHGILLFGDSTTGQLDCLVKERDSNAVEQYVSATVSNSAVGPGKTEFIRVPISNSGTPFLVRFGFYDNGADGLIEVLVKKQVLRSNPPLMN